MNPLNYCIATCTCTAFFITQIQMLYVTVTSVTLCDQYRVSTSLYRHYDITHICAALHTHNWRCWYYRQIKSHYMEVISSSCERLMSVSQCLYLVLCTLKTNGSCDERDIILTAHAARLASFFRLFVMLWDHKCLTY